MDLLDEKELQRMIAFRKELHMYPEIGFQEF